MKKYIMGVDHGGSSSKAVIFDFRGNVIASSKQSMAMQTSQPGFTERDMELLWQMHCEVIRQALLNAGLQGDQIAALSFSGHGKGLYLWERTMLLPAPALCQRTAEPIALWKDGMRMAQQNRFSP